MIILGTSEKFTKEQILEELTSIRTLDGLKSFFENRVRDSFLNHWENDMEFRQDFRYYLKDILDCIDFKNEGYKYLLVACFRTLDPRFNPVNIFLLPRKEYSFLFFAFLSSDFVLPVAAINLSNYLSIKMELKEKFLEIEDYISRISFISKRNRDSFANDVLENYGYDSKNYSFFHPDAAAMIIAYEEKLGGAPIRNITNEEFYSEVLFRQEEYEILERKENDDKTFDLKLKLKIFDDYEINETFTFSEDNIVNSSNIHKFLRMFKKFDENVLFSLNVKGTGFFTDNRMCYTSTVNQDGEIEQRLLMFIELDDKIYFPVRNPEIKRKDQFEIVNKIAKEMMEEQIGMKIEEEDSDADRLKKKFERK